MEKFYREDFKSLEQKQEKEKKDLINRAHEEALKDEEKMKKLSSEIEEIKTGESQEEKQAEIKEGISIENAREIMGKDFLGHEAVKNIFGIELETIPPIQFTKEDLERARELDQALILQVDKMKDGEPMTLKNMKSRFLTAHDGKNMWYDQNWYNNEEFFTKETPKIGWKLVSKEIIPDSTSKNYLKQTGVLIQYIKEEVFKNKPIPKEYQSAINEFESLKSDIASIIDSDRKTAADKLEKLQITKLIRENPVEVMYRFILQDQENKEKLLPSKCTWTLGRDSGGRFVDVGDFDASGVSVSGSTPDDRGGRLGASFSRSL